MNNSSACWNDCHENCWDWGCACICHIDGFSWKDADKRVFK